MGWYCEVSVYTRLLYVGDSLPKLSRLLVLVEAPPFSLISVYCISVCSVSVRLFLSLSTVSLPFISVSGYSVSALYFRLCLLCLCLLSVCLLSLSYDLLCHHRVLGLVLGLCLTLCGCLSLYSTSQLSVLLSGYQHEKLSVRIFQD